MIRRSCSQAGVSIFEVLIASTILVIATTALYALYGQSLRALKYANESAAADLYFRSQVDTLRSCSWAVLTGTGISSNFAIPTSILPDPTSDLNLKTLPSVTSQRLTVLSTTSGTYYTTFKNGSGTRIPPTSAIPSSISSQSALLVLFNLQWSSQNGAFTREYSTIISAPNN